VGYHPVSLGLSEASVQWILHKVLHFYPYKIQVTHALHKHDYGNRVNFCQTFLQLINQNQELVNNLLTSDEAHFHLSGFVNKQNFHCWSATNPIELHERPLHSSKVTVWWAISSFGIISPYFFEDEREKAVTVTGPCYVHMLENFLGPELACHRVTKEMFFQQDWATRHTAQDPWQLWGICFLTMLSPDMGTSHGQPGHPILQHVISFSGGIWNLMFSKLQHPPQFRSWNTAFSKKSNKFLWRCFRE